jgi:hypothetical protein
MEVIVSDKVAIFGDVHGQAKMLERLIEEVKKECGDDVDLYSLGDLIDRGPNSSGVLDLCIKHNIKGIMSNHDLWLRNLVRDRVFDDFALAPIMGGEWTFLSYNIYDFSNKNKAALDLLQVIPKEHRDFLIDLPDYRMIEVDGHKYWLIHAGLSASNAASFRPLGQAVSDEEMMEGIVKSGKPENFIMWPSPPLPNKMRPQHRMFRFDEGTQVLGHKPLKEPMVTKDFIALDTGCGTCDPFTLSAILLPSRKVIQVAEEGSWTD